MSDQFAKFDRMRRTLPAVNGADRRDIEAAAVTLAQAFGMNRRQFAELVVRGHGGMKSLTLPRRVAVDWIEG